MFRFVCVLALVAAPAAATTCPEYVEMMRAEGVRTLVAAECASATAAAQMEGHWNDILDGPYGSCLISRTIAGDTNAVALAAYMDDMNRQRAELGCPRESQ